MEFIVILRRKVFEMMPCTVRNNDDYYSRPVRTRDQVPGEQITLLMIRHCTKSSIICKHLDVKLMD